MIYPAPKPKPKRGRRGAPTGLRRTRMKSRGKKGSAFPKQRDREYRRWVWTENPCMLRGATIRVRFSEHDEMLPIWGYVHRCWGAITPAHVGPHQARGAPDFGVLVPLCKAAHQRYDEHRDEWPRVTRYDEKAMASAASCYALRWVDRGGAP
jgi:hypothetical protein